MALFSNQASFGVSDTGLTQYQTPAPLPSIISERDLRWQGENSVSPLAERLLPYVLNPSNAWLDLSTLKSYAPLTVTGVPEGGYFRRFPDQSLILESDAKARNPAILARLFVDLPRADFLSIVSDPRYRLSQETIEKARGLIGSEYNQRVERRTVQIEEMKHAGRVDFWTNMGFSLFQAAMTLGTVWAVSASQAAAQAGVQAGVNASQAAAVAPSAAIQPGATAASYGITATTAAPLSQTFGQSVLAAPLSLAPSGLSGGGVGVAFASAAGTLPALPLEAVRLGITAPQLQASAALAAKESVQQFSKANEAIPGVMKAGEEFSQGRIGSGLTTLVETIFELPIRAIDRIFNPPAEAVARPRAASLPSAGGSMEIGPSNPASENMVAYLIGGVLLLFVLYGVIKKG